MYTLILIVSFIANGAAVEVDHIPFNNKSACQTALIEILNDTKSNHNVTVVSGGSLAVRGYCVSKD